MARSALILACAIFAACPTVSFAQASDPCPGGQTDCNWDDIADDDDEPSPTSPVNVAASELEGSIIEELLPSSLRTSPTPPSVPGGEFILASIHGFPETKTEMVMRCVKIFGKRMCTKIPKVYKRVSKLEVIGQVQTPRWDKIKADITVCVNGAIGAGVAAGAVTGAIPAAAAAFEAYMKGCLAAKSKKYIKDLKVGLYTRKTPGPWQPI